MTDEIPDDATEITDARLPRVDLVKAPASGMPFFIAKSSLEEEQEVTDPVEKSDAEEILATAVASPKLGDERPANAPGDPDDPSSSAWEAVDAANARAAVNTLVALKQLVGGLLERESLETFTGEDCEDSENAYDLDGVLCALDCALGVLARFAVTEQAEADERAEDSLLKALASLTPDLADAVVADIVKAGRVLSSTNEAAIRGAVEQLQKVLDSLPAAKEADMTKADETVETDDVTKADEATTAVEPVEETVTKADDMSSLSDDDLKRLAITGEDGERAAALAEIGLRVLTGSDGDADEADDDSADPADVDPGDAGVTADDVTKSTTEDADEAPVDPIQKALADQKAEFDSVVKALQDRVDALEESPAPRRVLANGAVPTPEMLRGQDVTTESPLQKAVAVAAAITDPDQRQEAVYGLLRDRYSPQNG